MRALCTVLGFTAIGACQSPDTDSLHVVERVPLSDLSYETLHLDSSDVWLGSPGQLVRLDRAGRERARLVLGETASPRYIGRHGELAYYQSGTSVAVIDTRADSVLTERGEMGGDGYAVDVRGRFLLRPSEIGAVTAHDPVTLEPLWGWASVGAPASALAVSPEGDRVYQALGALGSGSAPEFLVRDMQTGRILARVALVEPIRTLITGPDGSIYALTESSGRGGGITRLKWRGGALESVWRHSFAELDVPLASSLALAPSGSRLALLAPEDSAGLLLLDAETGSAVGRLHGDALATAFDDTGQPFLLYRGELRRIDG